MVIRQYILPITVLILTILTAILSYTELHPFATMFITIIAVWPIIAYVVDLPPKLQKSIENAIWIGI
jgi:hypothetical protein